MEPAQPSGGAWRAVRVLRASYYDFAGDVFPGPRGLRERSKRQHLVMTHWTPSSGVGSCGYLQVM